MDFHELMHVAASKQQETMKKVKMNRYSLDLPPPKKEEKSKLKSETVQKFLQEKEREKQSKERARKAKEQKEREERERKEKEERKKNQFRIPKKKPEEVVVDKKQLIDSLFEDGDGDSDAEAVDTDEKRNSDGRSHTSSASSKHSSKDTTPSAKQSSSHRSHKSSSGDDRRSHSSSHKSSSSSSSKHLNGLSSSSSSTKHSNSHSHSASSKRHKEESSTSSKHSKGVSSSKGADKKPNGTLHKESKQPLESSKSSSNDSNPIALNKNHLNPIQERHVENSQLSEKALILARLQAIKERTLAAFAKENEGKGKRVKGVKSQRKSRTEEMNEKAKSSEMVKDNISSDEEDGDCQDMPSALDIMLSERNAKLEKERIARLAKQAWERATKGDSGGSESDSKRHKEKKMRKSEDKSGHRDRREKAGHKSRSEDRISPLQEPSASRPDVPRPKKPVVVRHAGNNAPPPLDFKTIMAIAEQKSKEPAKPAGVFNIPKKKKEEEKRPMTQEEKNRVERRKTKEYQDWLKHGGKPPKDHARHSISDDEEEAEPTPTPSAKLSSKPAGLNKASAGDSRSVNTSQKVSVSSHHKHSSDNPSRGTNSPSHRPAGGHSRDSRHIPVNENLLVCGPEEDEDESEEEAETTRSAPQLNPFDKIMGQVHKKRPSSHQPVKPSKRMRIDSEEEEEDSDMDDFIDDGDDGELDYSKEIRKMFGYDKSRFKHEREDDLSDMEANFSTVMAEEKRSAKLGLMEDLEDMRREEEELRQKAALKKKMMRKHK